MMKRFYLFLPVAALAASLSLPLASSAQTKCKNVYSQADPFTKQMIYNSQQPIGPILGGWTFILRQEGPKFMIGVGIQNGQGVSDALKKGSTISLLLSDESTLVITTSKDYPASPLQIGEHMYGQWVVCEEVSKADFTRLSQFQIKALKTNNSWGSNTNREFILPGIKERQSERIMTTAACMLTNNTSTSGQ